MSARTTRVSYRVAICANSSWNIYNFRGGIIRTLLARGNQVTVLAPLDEYSKRLEEIGCQFQPIKVDSRGVNPINDFALIVRYLRALRSLRPHVLLTYTIKPNIYASIAARHLGIPVINNVSGLGTAFLSGDLLQSIAKVLCRSAFARSHSVFFQNEDDLALFLKQRLVKTGQADLLPGSGIDLTRFTPEAEPNSSRGGLVQFLLIGRVLFDKGIGEYVEAARLLKAEGLKCRFLILGFMDAVNRSAVGNDTMNSWIAEGAVEYLGPTDDVRPFIMQADCIVLPSYREGAPKSLIEAAAMARPVVATDVPGCRSIVEDGKNGLLCRVKDAPDLARCMRAIARMSAEQRKRMGEYGRMKIEREFDEAIVVARYLRAIDSV